MHFYTFIIIALVASAAVAAGPEMATSQRSCGEMGLAYHHRRDMGIKARRLARDQHPVRSSSIPVTPGTHFSQSQDRNETQQRNPSNFVQHL